MPAPATPTRFAGFDRDALQFFHALIGWLVKHCRATAPLASWLYRHVK